MSELAAEPLEVKSIRIIQLLQTEGYAAVRATLSKDKHILTRTKSVDFWALVEIHFQDGRVETRVEGMAIEPTVHSLEADLEEGFVFLGYDSYKLAVGFGFP